MKKILFVTHLFYPALGGVEVHIKRLTKGLAEIGYEVKVLTSNAFSTEAFFLKDKRRINPSHEVADGVEVERLDFRTYGRKTLNTLRSLACRVKYPFNEWVRFYSFGPRNPLFLEKSIQFKPDIIFASPLPMFNIYYAHKAAKKLNVPLIINPAYHIHDTCSYFNSIYFRIMEDSELVAVHSEAVKKYLVERGSIDPRKISVFPPFPFEETDLIPDKISSSKEEIKKKYGISQKYALLCVGQHGRHKNIISIFKAMQGVWRVVSDVALVIAGGTTAYTPELKQLASDCDTGSSQRIYFIDDFPAESKEEIYVMSDIFISLSELESFGIVFVEAMKYQLPVIASIHNIASSAVDDFNTGLLVDPQCELKVTGAVLELLLDDKIRIDYGKRGRAKVLEKYAPAAILSKWEKVLENI